MDELRREVIIAQGYHRVNQRGVHKIGTGREGIIEEINEILISSFLEIDFEISISDKKSRRFDLSEVIFIITCF